MYVNAGQYNNFASPSIMVVPFGAAVVASIVMLLSGPEDEPPLSRALFGAGFATWVLSLVFPLR